ncbi:MAG: hypothetical protein HY956_01515 [Deltaproteobacteria bacterium]|nr:hypothetical protein [Deltaproteobacteria bacterium]
MTVLGRRAFKSAVAVLEGNGAAFITFCTIFLSVLFIPSLSDAYPFFSRQVGRDCTFCHSIFPKLNETGRMFRSGGYRLPAEAEWKEVKDLSSIPASVEVEVEASYNDLASNGAKSDSSDLKIEEIELFAGGAFGKTGRLSVNSALTFEETEAGADVSITKAFLQVNDLLGPMGEGRLNLRAGKWDIGLPFINTIAPISNRYLAESAIGVLSIEKKALELNGTFTSEGETLTVTQRWAVGASREEIESDDKLKGAYALYSVTFQEDYSLGALVRTGEEATGGADESYTKYGVAGEAELGPTILTLGYFRSDALYDADDFLVEAFWLPRAKVKLGIRYEYLKEDGSQGVSSQTLMARYNILSNAYIQAEYRLLSDEDHVTSVNEDETKLRAFLVAVF